MTTKVLRLTLYRKWFDAIASGEKTEEYRTIKPYWIRRLCGKKYDEVHFSNGYGKNVPFMRVEYKGLETGKLLFTIKLGKVLEVRE